MPELPEIEHLRLTLEPQLIGARVEHVQLRRPDVLHGDPPSTRGRGAAARLLEGATIAALRRHGKNLAIISDRGAVVCAHMGMSGQLRVLPPAQRLSDSRHVHCMWRLNGAATGARLIFRDPRRFGGLWTFASVEELLARRWSKLGPDALTIDAAALHAAVENSRRSIKCALLDQAVLAGVGNIYADEALFMAGIHPLARADRLTPGAVKTLAAAIRTTLARAIAAGGSTIRDYVDANGRSGGYAWSHSVYGRAGERCVRCGRPLRQTTVSQRTTVFCHGCQRKQR